MKGQKMKTMMLNAVMAACFCSALAQAEEENPIAALDWKIGPTTARVGSSAKQEVEDGFAFLEASEARKFSELNQNPSSDSDVGVIAPKDLSWCAYYMYEDIGYVSDDEKDSLDSDALLESLKKGTEHSNIERRRQGWPEMTIVGWAREPHYDEKTHNLEWATKYRTDNGTGINYTTKILGRHGVMNVILVCGSDQLPSVLPEFKSALRGFSYNAGSRYFEFRKGDRVAEVGLSALILGGATAAAVKTGAFKWLWKGIVVIALAIGGLFKKIFGGGKKDQ